MNSSVARWRKKRRMSSKKRCARPELPPESLSVSLPKDVARFSVACSYKIENNGALLIEVNVTLGQQPREVAENRDPTHPARGNQHLHLVWPAAHENYADRKQSAKAGLYTGSVDEQYTPYGRPQEKTATRAMSAGPPSPTTPVWGCASKANPCSTSARTILRRKI